LTLVEEEITKVIYDYEDGMRLQGWCAYLTLSSLLLWRKQPLVRGWCATASASVTVETTIPRVFVCDIKVYFFMILW